MRRLQQAVYGRQLVDERQGDAERVLWRARRIRKVGRVRERVDVVQVLHPACQRHFLTLYKTETFLLRVHFSRAKGSLFNSNRAVRKMVKTMRSMSSELR